jgi:hypothetical protein
LEFDSRYGKQILFVPLHDVDNYFVVNSAPYKVDVSHGIKQPQRGADHLTSPSVKIMNVRTVPQLIHTFLHVVMIN